ncbi:hypothetical protein NTE_01190 [Candidatus Nitrososphaera evergladensis SR1]|uniref:Uncharacterized protein n=1 Tax=Candidatus Nitrososphaera evergladensis SR1 TaxID=1459636 RepID=A0A075MR19_9ARCH|nr:hypothetical protein [Candidatus Nitrososphaera evergladensis]AIF83262.1 hypothetical protein NTE_01190 [Candidatus Nitrososphaera evergladensis SR1]
MSLFAGASKIAAVVAAGYIIAFFVLASGGLNAATEGSKVAAFIVPSRSVQTPGETGAITLILVIGLAGMFMLHRAGKSAGARAQRIMLAGGFGVVAVALMIGYLLVNVKL